MAGIVQKPRVILGYRNITTKKSKKKIRFQKACKEQEILDLLTPAQRAAIKKANNTIRDHMNKRDYQALVLEAKGVEFYKQNGIRWNHQQECYDSLRSLNDSIRSISNSLRNPNLKDNVRIYLSNKLDYYKKIYARFAKQYKGEERI